MWKPEHRRPADRSHLRYPSDLTDAEWALVEPLIRPGRHGGPRAGKQSTHAPVRSAGVSALAGLAEV